MKGKRTATEHLGTISIILFRHHRNKTDAQFWLSKQNTQISQYWSFPHQQLNDTLRKINKCQHLYIIIQDFSHHVLYLKKTTEDVKQAQNCQFPVIYGSKIGCSNYKGTVHLNSMLKNSWAHNPPRHPPPSNIYPLLPFHSGWNLTLPPRLLRISLTQVTHTTLWISNEQADAGFVQSDWSRQLPPPRR